MDGFRPPARSAPGVPSLLPSPGRRIASEVGSETARFRGKLLFSVRIGISLKTQMGPIGKLGGSLGWAVWAGRTVGGSAYFIAVPRPLLADRRRPLSSARRGFDSGGWLSGLGGDPGMGEDACPSGHI